jgi:hypothetical protein
LTLIRGDLFQKGGVLTITVFKTMTDSTQKLTFEHLELYDVPRLVDDVPQIELLGISVLVVKVETCLWADPTAPLAAAAK